MTTHVAILRPHYIDLVLEGTKAIEARLSACRIAPFGMVETGDELLFRAGAMGYIARASVGRVWSFDSLTPAGIRRLKSEFGSRVNAPADFWTSKRAARFATFLELRRVRPIRHGPNLLRKPGDRRAWFVLDSAIRRAA